MLKAALKHYGLALSFGSQFIYQSMPRLLSLWLDYGTDYARHSSAVSGTKSGGTGDHRTQADQRTFQEIQEVSPIVHFGMSCNCPTVIGKPFGRTVGHAFLLS